MRILKIGIKNLASLEGMSELDFTTEPLKSAGLFAITGPTGSGKSTILDALCLALYGKTPRYNQAKESGIEIQDVAGNKIGQGDIRGILRDGTSDGKAEVEFVGVDGNNYKASWSVRRARNKPDGKIQAFEMELLNMSTNLPFPGNKTDIQPEIQRLVGLNFEQFTRSVLLAQGDFTAFLKANKDEKASLLEKLTGTHIYSEISKMVFERYRNEEQELRELNLRKEGIEVLSQEEIEAYQTEKTTLDQEIANKESIKTNLNRELQWHIQLSNITTNIETARKTVEIATNERDAATERKITLSRIDQVQDIRVTVSGIGETQTTISKLKEDLTNLKIEVEAKLKQKTEAVIIQQKTELDITEAAKKKQDAATLITEARRLDTLIKEKESQIASADLVVVAAKERHDKAATEINEAQAKNLDLAADISNVSLWITQNQSRKLIAENSKLLVSRLGDEKRTFTEVQRLLSEILTKENQIEKAKTKVTEIDNSLVEKNLQITNLKNVVETEERALTEFSIQQTINEKGSIDNILSQTIESQGHWRIFHATSSDYENLKSKLARDSETRTVKEGLLKEINSQVEIFKAKKEASQKLLERVRFEATADIKKLRTLLQPGEACLVCGSEHHPYIEHSPEFDRVLNTINDEHSENERIYEESLSSQIGLKESISTLAASINDLTDHSSLKETAINQHRETWLNFPVGKESLDIPTDKIDQWLSEKIGTLTTAQKNLQSAIQTYNDRKGTLEIKKNELTNLEKGVGELENEKRDYERTILSSSELIKSTTSQKNDLLIQVSKIEQEINVYFSGEEWIERYRSDPDSFIEQLTTFSAKWIETVTSHETKNQSMAVLNTELARLEEQLRNLYKIWFDENESLSKQKEGCEILKSERHKIFEGQPVDIVEKGFEDTITTLTNSIKVHKAKVDELTINFTELSTKVQQQEAAIVQAAEKAWQLQEQFTNWLSQFNAINSLQLAFTNILVLLEYNHEWIDRERNSLQTIADNLNKSSSILHEHEGALQTHVANKLSDKTLDVVKDLLVSNEEHLSNSNKRSNEISFTLRNNTENIARIGDLLIQIAAKAELFNNWSKLNEVIGSADGKKFRQVAQEYTLDVLLDFANVHLGSLSSRYIIQRIPDSLGLQVVDMEMGNEIRTVFTLSGGESFLVSLALALGLASLSSNRMKVESLFIDEGFGSLDPNTLSIAMDALERLHNQGRKVGVISHVQEMTERIPTQIKVKKLSSGKGKIEVESIF